MTYTEDLPENRASQAERPRFLPFLGKVTLGRGPRLFLTCGSVERGHLPPRLEPLVALSPWAGVGVVPGRQRTQFVFQSRLSQP